MTGTPVDSAGQGLNQRGEFDSRPLLCATEATRDTRGPLEVQRALAEAPSVMPALGDAVVWEAPCPGGPRPVWAGDIPHPLHHGDTASPPPPFPITFPSSQQ